MVSAGEQKRQFAKTGNDKGCEDERIRWPSVRSCVICHRKRQPEFVTPQLALLAAKPPSEAGWLHELKLDGYRMQARKDGSGVQMLTRTGLDWTQRVRTVANEVAKLAGG